MYLMCKPIQHMQCPTSVCPTVPHRRSERPPPPIPPSPPPSPPPTAYVGPIHEQGWYWGNISRYLHNIHTYCMYVHCTCSDDCAISCINCLWVFESLQERCTFASSILRHYHQLTYALARQSQKYMYSISPLLISTSRLYFTVPMPFIYFVLYPFHTMPITHTHTYTHTTEKR